MSDTTYPLNAWYAAGWGVSIGADLTPIRICNLPLILFRDAEGEPHALLDACPHRLLPLSMGRWDGRTLTCGYHGMTFNADGRCTRMPGPGSTRPGPMSHARALPIRERHKLVWVWPGEPALADPAGIPDLHWANDPDWASAGSEMPMRCDYRLVIDNLMDLTHEAFVHAGSIGDARITEAPFEVERRPGGARLTRWMIDVHAPPFLAAQLERAHGALPEHVDRWQIIDFTAPSAVVIDVGVALSGTGAPEGDRSKGISGRVLNAVTPEGPGSCHYFFAYARNFALDDAALTDRVREQNIGIFLEDKAVLEAQQSRIEALDQPLRNYAIDRGSLEARRTIAAMIDAEGGAGAAARERQPA